MVTLEAERAAAPPLMHKLLAIIGASLSEPHSICSEDSSAFCIGPSVYTTSLSAAQRFNGNNCVFYIPNLASPRSQVNMAWDRGKSQLPTLAL